MSLETVTIPGVPILSVARSTASGHRPWATPSPQPTSKPSLARILPSKASCASW